MLRHEDGQLVGSAALDAISLATEDDAGDLRLVSVYVEIVAVSDGGEVKRFEQWAVPVREY